MSVKRKLIRIFAGESFISYFIYYGQYNWQKND